MLQPVRTVQSELRTDKGGGGREGGGYVLQGCVGAVGGARRGEGRGARCCRSEERSGERCCVGQWCDLVMSMGFMNGLGMRCVWHRQDCSL